MRWWIGILVAVVAFGGTDRSASGEAAREIVWETLLPPAATEIRKELQGLQVQLRSLPADARAALPRIAAEASLKSRMSRWHLSEASLSASERRVLEDSPSAAYPVAAALWSDLSGVKGRLHALEAVVNEPLDGQTVRLSGYLLPLEVDREKVYEFLLVPFVGACIHVPPPPPNQIVHVRIDNGYEPEFQYEPVTVTGILAAQAGRYDLFLEDGEAPVDVGYRLQAEVVAPLERTRL